MAQLTWNQVQAPNMRDANMLMSDAMDRQGIGGAMIAKSLGNIGQDIQNRRDAKYLAQLNQYGNDPIAMENALRDGSISQAGVSKDTLEKGSTYLTNASKNALQNYLLADTKYMNDEYAKYSGDLSKIMAAGETSDKAGYTQGINNFKGNFRLLKGLGYTDDTAARASMAQVGLAGRQYEDKLDDADALSLVTTLVNWSKDLSGNVRFKELIGPNGTLSSQALAKLQTYVKSGKYRPTAIPKAIRLLESNYTGFGPQTGALGGLNNGLATDGTSGTNLGNSRQRARTASRE